MKRIQKTSSFVPLPVLKIRHAPHHHAPYHNHHESSYTRIQTTSLPVTQSMNPKKVERFLNKCHPRLLRAKGYLSLEGKGTYLMQHAAKRTSWQLTSCKRALYRNNCDGYRYRSTQEGMEQIGIGIKYPLTQIKQ